jgi:nickel-dependent lactate racemase
MRSIELLYGQSRVPFDYDESRFEIIGEVRPSRELSDREIGNLFDSPVDSETLEEIVGANETVLIVVPDATRNVGTGQIINLLVRRLIAAGTMAHEINVVFATGLHRTVSEKERDAILTPFISQRIKTFDHDPNDLGGFLKLGETVSGIPIELNRNLVEADHVILIGGIGFHYFAGFTGARKLICPGLASKRTITATHGLAFDTVNLKRADGVGPGLLDANPVNEAFWEIVEKISPSFAFNTIVDDSGIVTDLVCGHWRNSHKKACLKYSDSHVHRIPEKRELVIVSCGGSPQDLNMVQSHKAIEMASYACLEGGTIIVLAECLDGPGSPEFSKWFDYGTSSTLATRLAERYAVGGQTAWSLLNKSERFNINIVTKLNDEMTSKMGLRKCRDFAEALSRTEPSTNGYILPYGSKFLPVLN